VYLISRHNPQADRQTHQGQFIKRPNVRSHTFTYIGREREIVCCMTQNRHTNRTGRKIGPGDHILKYFDIYIYIHYSYIYIAILYISQPTSRRVRWCRLRWSLSMNSLCSFHSPRFTRALSCSFSGAWFLCHTIITKTREQDTERGRRKS
jgi:hypothetical protein